MVKVVVLDSATLNPGDLDWSPLEKLGELKVFDRTSEELRIDRLKDARIVIANKVELDRFILDKLPHLKCICVSATGVNNVDINKAKELGISVFCAYPQF